MQYKRLDASKLYDRISDAYDDDSTSDWIARVRQEVRQKKQCRPPPPPPARPSSFSYASWLMPTLLKRTRLRHFDDARTTVVAESTTKMDDADIVCDAIFITAASTPPLPEAYTTVKEEEARKYRLTKALLLTAYHMRTEGPDSEAPRVPTFLDSDEARLETALLELWTPASHGHASR